MIRAGLLTLALSGQVAAQATQESLDCLTVWGKASGALISATDAAVTGAVGIEGDWCTADGVVIDLDGQYSPDWHIDRLKFRGTALGWMADGSTLPEGLEVVVDDLRVVLQTGDPQMDWLFAAQSRPNAIDAELSLVWDPAARELRLEGLSIDFPGENLVEASGAVTGVDLSSTGAAQMSATSFALTGFDMRITTHGLFEWYALMALGPMVLPYEGDMDVAAEAMRAEILAGVAALPETSVSNDSKAALVALIDELPNPSGNLVLSLRAEPGIGPVRFGGYAVTGVPETLAEAAPLFQGVVLNVEWTHADAP